MWLSNAFKPPFSSVNAISKQLVECFYVGERHLLPEAGNWKRDGPNEPRMTPGDIFDIANKLAGCSDNLGVARDQTSKADGSLYMYNIIKGIMYRYLTCMSNNQFGISSTKPSVDVDIHISLFGQI